MRGAQDYTEARAAWNMAGYTWRERLAPWTHLVLPGIVGFVGVVGFVVSVPLAIIFWSTEEE